MCSKDDLVYGILSTPERAAGTLLPQGPEGTAGDIYLFCLEMTRVYPLV